MAHEVDYLTGDPEIDDPTSPDTSVVVSPEPETLGQKISFYTLVAPFCLFGLIMEFLGRYFFLILFLVFICALGFRVCLAVFS